MTQGLPGPSRVAIWPSGSDDSSAMDEFRSITCSMWDATDAPGRFGSVIPSPTTQLFDKPEWLDPPRGPDVSMHTPYVPLVTYFQLVIDLILGTNAPVGHGHKFGPAQAEAWSLILPPNGWTTEDSEALVAVVDS